MKSPGHQPQESVGSHQWMHEKKMEEHLDEILLNPIQKGASETKEDPPVLGLQVSAGLGKTLTALKCIAKQGAEILKGGHILFYVPTLNLAEEAHTEFQNLNSKLPSLGVGGGRSQLAFRFHMSGESPSSTKLPSAPCRAIVDNLTIPLFKSGSISYETSSTAIDCAG